MLFLDASSEVNPFEPHQEGKSFEELYYDIQNKALVAAEEGFQRIRTMQEEVAKRTYGDNLYSVSALITRNQKKHQQAVEHAVDNIAKEQEHGSQYETPRVPVPILLEPY